jgi:hypothetical protein
MPSLSSCSLFLFRFLAQSADFPLDPACGNIKFYHPAAYLFDEPDFPPQPNGDAA